MSEITPTSPAPSLPPSEIPQHPTDLLLEMIVSFLAPMFLFGPGGDIGYARLAALETVNAYCIETQADLIAVAQVVAFGLAALASLSQSMDDGLSVSMALRLRSNANACNRSAEQNRRTLGTHRPAPAKPVRVPASSSPAPSMRPTQPQASARNIAPMVPEMPGMCPLTEPDDQDIDTALIAALLGIRGGNDPRIASAIAKGHVPPPDGGRPAAP